MEQVKRYIYQVYKEKSFSAAAKSLYISQPALSATISRFEKEVGIKIFDRTKQPISLTSQGLIYIESIEEIMRIEDNVEKRIRQLSDMSYGSLSVGGSSFASYRMMPNFCAAFYKKYPQIKVTLDLGNRGEVDFLSERLKRGEIDLLITYIKDDDRFIYEPLIEEKPIIAMRNDAPWAEKLRPFALTHKQLISGDFDKEKEIEDMSIFKDVSFVGYQNSVNTDAMIQMIGDYNIVPYTIMNSRHSEVHYELMLAGIGAVLIPCLPIMCSRHIDEDVLYFIPKTSACSRTIYIARTHLTDDNPIAQNFIQMAKEVCANIKLP